MEITRTSSRSGGRRCPFCHDALRRLDATTDCPACGAAHHPACWEEGDGCASCRTALRDTGEPPVVVQEGGFDVLHVRRAHVPEGAPRARPITDRMRIEEDAAALTITLPSPRACLQSAFLAFWLCGWLAGEVFALGALVAPGTPLPARGFLLFWLTFWTIGGLAALRALLDGLGGAAALRLDHEALTIHKSALGVPLARSFRVATGDVRAVRAAGASVIVEHAGGAYDWSEPTEGEAAAIVERVRARLDMKG